MSTPRRLHLVSRGEDKATMAHDTALREEGVVWGSRILTTAQLLTLPVQRQEMLVDGLIPGGQAGLLAGDGRTGKTLLVLQLARARARGETFLGRAVQAGPSLLCLCDDAQGLTVERARQMFTPEDDEVYWFVDRYDDQAYGEMAAVVAAKKPGLVVIDTLAMITPSVPNAENDPPTMKGVMEPYTRWANSGVTVLFVHHMNAQGGIRGCSGIRNNVHFSLALENTGVLPEGERLVKVSVDWKYAPVPPIVLQHDGAGFMVTTQQAGQRLGRQRVRLLALMGADAVSIATLYERGKGTVAQSTIRREILAMTQEGVLLEQGRDTAYRGTGTAPLLYARKA